MVQRFDAAGRQHSCIQRRTGPIAFGDSAYFLDEIMGVTGCKREQVRRFRHIDAHRR